MRIGLKLIIVYSIIIVATISITSYLAIQYTESAVIESELAEMKNVLQDKENQIQNLHSRASEDLVFALQNQLFVQYFELPETRAGDTYKDGVLQFTERQREIKTQLDEWIYHFQNKFQVDETCLIDTTGQEHTRLVLKGIAPDTSLSPNEEQTPFFYPSFETNKGEVHIQYPYVSPDTHRWVFAYTSPVVLGDGTTPAFYHFEMPVSIFQNLVTTSVGRMYVIDPQGYLIADSEHTYPTADISSIPTKYFAPVDTISSSQEFGKMIKNMMTADEGIATYQDGNDHHYVVYKKLPTFYWIIAYDKPSSLMLMGDTHLDQLKSTIIIVASAITVAGLAIVAFVSARISRPMRKLADSCRTQNVDNLLPLRDDSRDEVGDVKNAINSLIERMSQKEDQIYLQYEELQQKTGHIEKLATIGEIASRLSHNLRNPLAVIKSSIDIINSTSKKDLDPKLQERLHRISVAAENMSKQVEDVLTFVRNKPLDTQPNSLLKIITSAIKNIEKPDTVRIVLPEKDFTLACDENKIQVVFMNLITNSIQAMDNTGEIIIKAETNNKDIVIRVQDSGTGISDDDMPKVFDSLFTTKTKGTGLGLTYCKGIVEQHGGQITVSNNPTVFTILLPNSIVELTSTTKSQIKNIKNELKKN